MNKQRKRIVPNVVRGGTAIPIGDNLFYMQGRKHEQGGIDIGDNAKTGLEVEGGEVIQTSPKSIKVFSSVPFLYGGSPANLVMSGADPNKVFNAQEEFKDKNNINDDGTKKENGGDKKLSFLVNSVLSRPANFVQRLKDKNRKVIRDWEDTTKVATHKLGAEYVNGVPVIYPNVQEIDGELIDFTRPPYDTWAGLDNAIERGDTVQAKSLQDAIDFTENYKDYIPNMKQYKNGGLSRSKNYGSSKKPYLSIKSEDFAGGNRSYPIPTKADAVDALRLAGLHGRSDVKTKVYKKYPELRKRKDLGGEEDLIKYGVGETPWLNGLGYDKPFGIEIVRFNNDKGNPEVVYEPRFKINIPTSKLQIPTFDVDSLVTKALIKTLPETLPGNKGNGNISSSSTGVDQKATTSPTARTTSTNSGIPQRELNETYRQYSGAIQRNVPIPTARATTNSGQNLDSRIKELINNRIEENIDNRNNKTSKNRNVIPAILDSVGSLIDIGGNITSNILNRNMLNDLEYVDAPIPLLPTKLKTRININPQLERLYSDLAQMENAVNNNTASSRTALARNQRLRNRVRQASNELYGNKENIETQLINKDRLNQQAVAAQNLRDYNTWKKGKAEFDNQIRETLAENNVALTQGIGQSLNTLVQNLQQRNTEAKNLSYLAMSNPYAIDALTSIDFRDLYRMFGGFRCGGKKKVNRK